MMTKFYLLLLSLCSYLALSSCNHNSSNSHELTPDMVTKQIDSTLRLGNVYRWNEEKTTNGVRFSAENIKFPGELKVSNVRFSDNRDSIRVTVIYSNDGLNQELLGFLKRDEFGIYTGVLELPDDLNISLTVTEP